MSHNRSILRIHVHGLGPADHERYEHAQTVLRDITPLVQALPPTALTSTSGPLHGARRVPGGGLARG
jgi:DNA polymerase IV